MKDLVNKTANTEFVDEFGRTVNLDDTLYDAMKSLRGDNDLGRLNVTTAPGRAGGCGVFRTNPADRQHGFGPGREHAGR